jgi:tryptophan synthase beta chain
MPEMIGRQPDAVIACVGGGSNAMGIFYPYIDRPETRLIGVEAAGQGLATGRHAASLSAGSPECCTATGRTCCRMRTGQILETHSISAGLDYRASARACASQGHRRAEYVGITDDEALAAFHRLLPHRGHHSGARVEPCGRPCHEDRADDAVRPASAGQSVGSR